MRGQAFMYDGLNVVEEVDGSNNIIRRFAHGDRIDDPILTDEGSAMNCTGTRFPRTDERGSVVALANCSAAVVGINRYDEYGKPQSGNIGRMQYTGQAWLPEANVYHYKARAYAPTFGGRFLQTDPIGYGGGMNLYAYVRNDPVNFVDPLGLNRYEQREITRCLADPNCDVVTGSRNPDPGSIRNDMLINAPGYGDPGVVEVAEIAADIIVTASARERVQRPAVTQRRGIGTRGLAGAALLDPTGFVIAGEVYDLTNAAADQRYSTSDSRHGQFRHVYAAVALTRLIGPSRALSILNAAEVSGNNPMGDRIQDNYNNDLGVALARNPTNRALSADQLAQQALSQGCVR